MVRLDIDLAFSEEETGTDAALPPFEGTITAAGSEVRVTISDPSRLPGNGRRTLAELSTVADALAKRGISVRLEGPDGPILHLGDVKSSLLQRVVTGSPHIRLGSVAALAPLLTRRNGGRRSRSRCRRGRRCRSCRRSTGSCRAGSRRPTTPGVRPAAPDLRHRLLFVGRVAPARVRPAPDEDRHRVR